MREIYIQKTHDKKLCKCGKICFDKKGAQSKRNERLRHNMRGRPIDYLRIYQCPESGGYWHLTSKPLMEEFSPIIKRKKYEPNDDNYNYIQ